MTPLLASRRRTLGWGLVVIALGLTAFAGVLILRRTSALIANVGKPAEPVMTQQLVVERLRAVAKLVATEMTLRDVVTYQQTTFGSTKRVLLVVTGKVSAGIDLEHGTEVRIDSAARRVTISLPPAQIFSVDVLNVTTYDERAGLWNPFQPEDRDAIQHRIRGQLVSAARESGILEHADQSAIKVLTELLGRDGYAVEVQRPIVVRLPTG
ncbi:MAG TPA: DUF4230 domain-containing protein [Gemmatimonadaceae bacterium]